jgi:predicted PurR-regulated permease PerM
VVPENPHGDVHPQVFDGDQLDIHTLLVFVAVLVGASLGGAAGAFVAVPAAAIVDIMVREVVVPWRQAQLSGRTTDGTARVGGPDPRVRAGPTRG